MHDVCLWLSVLPSLLLRIYALEYLTTCVLQHACDCTVLPCNLHNAAVLALVQCDSRPMKKGFLLKSAKQRQQPNAQPAVNDEPPPKNDVPAENMLHVCPSLPEHEPPPENVEKTTEHEPPPNTNEMIPGHSCVVVINANKTNIYNPYGGSRIILLHMELVPTDTVATMIEAITYKYPNEMNGLKRAGLHSLTWIAREKSYADPPIILNPGDNLVGYKLHELIANPSPSNQEISPRTRIHMWH